MSKGNNETSNEIFIDGIGAIVGVILFFLISLIMSQWSEVRNRYYEANPDFVEGTYILIGIPLLVPLFVLSAILIVKGIWTLGREALFRMQPQESI